MYTCISTLIVPCAPPLLLLAQPGSKPESFASCKHEVSTSLDVHRQTINPSPFLFQWPGLWQSSWISERRFRPVSNRRPQVNVLLREAVRRCDSCQQTRRLRSKILHLRQNVRQPFFWLQILQQRCPGRQNLLRVSIWGFKFSQIRKWWAALYVPYISWIWPYSAIAYGHAFLRTFVSDVEKLIVSYNNLCLPWGASTGGAIKHSNVGAFVFYLLFSLLRNG